jgi:hypothetical protein
MKRLLLIALILISAFTTLAFTLQKSTAQWEYKIEDVSMSQRIDINKLGADGWELVTVIDRGNSAAMFFKRPK